MKNAERAALAAVQFNWAVTPDAIWSPAEHHVDRLHANVVQTVLASVAAARRSTGGSPIGIALEGEKGVGKTHLLGWVRQRVQGTEGYFFLIKLVNGASFWPSAVRGILDGFHPGQGDQLTVLLRRLGEQADLDADLQATLRGDRAATRVDLDAFVAGLKRIDARVGADCQNTARALVLYRSPDPAAQEIGYSYFELDGDVEDKDRDTWGFRRGRRLPQQILGDLSRLLALTGPTVLAVDQIDSVMAQVSTGRTDKTGAQEARNRLVNELADGLMELRESTQRTLTVVACIPATWRLINTVATSPAADRFRVVTMQSQLPDAQIANDLIARRLAPLYAAADFEPPYPTWPILPSAFANDGARDFTPRRLLQRVDSHVRRCLESDSLTELASLDEQPEPEPARPGKHTAPTGLSRLDARFAELRDAADISGALDHQTEDQQVPVLLAAALTSYIAELGDDGQDFELDPAPGPKPALHARLRRTLDEQTDDEMHWCFRAIATEHARAALTRLRAARTEAGLEEGVSKRQLVILRNTRWSSGPKTREEIAEFTAAGGLSLPITVEDLKTFAALDALRRHPDPGFLQWLAARRPASSSELFRRVFGGTDPRAGEPPTDTRPTARARRARSATSDRTTAPSPVAGLADPVAAAPEVPIGLSTSRPRPFAVPLEQLRKHAVAFAGSGSGKTVLLRRLIEECALHGVSSIVLDPNNDLARLGDAWPDPPSGWGPGDPDKARAYLAGTEVVVWTPRRARGRPLAFRPLPDFSDVLEDADEFSDAVDAAVAGLVPRTQLTGRKVKTGQAVLTEALRYFARRGGKDLNAFVDLLSDLPIGISRVRSAQKVAADIAEALNVEMVNDPLFGGAGQALDPGILLTPVNGYRARVSVISFVGLPSEEQRQSFVNQLQMALFAWIKRNPAGDRPLGGLLVMDEAQTYAPSGAATACTASTLALAAQARKYGLGLVFATQAPRGLHNRIPGNATTQFFGLLNSGTQINAATELAKAKGGRVDDIARLPTGHFYAAGEGAEFERIKVPMCLSYHPPSPLTPDEVVERARSNGERPDLEDSANGV
ncbi:ATP-binding protein [Kribbella sindirgiensis]|uniref:ATP-binding protein n=1 Tax=Kribbella sindirgiensis TaxID=1124744 RepID=A0A4R0JDK7_9ACTN|nr:ATP-binding protein [Kribbella sindirgiensis]TCC43614.1 ATP-binding protein [Kribbella sindirgiensis]